MAVDVENKEIVYRYKTKLSGKGEQFYFNIPAFVVKNNYINVKNEYWIYFEKVDPHRDKKVSTKEQLQDLSKDLKNLIPFKAIPASAGSQYRITIPKFLIENNYIVPKSEKGDLFWIYIVIDKDSN